MSATALLSADQAGALALAGVTQVSPSGIVSRTVLQCPEMRVVLFTFADGQELTSHTNHRRALVQILDGTGDFLFDDEWHRATAGTLIHLPPDHPHAVRASAGPFSMLLILSAEPTTNPTAP